MPNCEICGREFASEAALAQHREDKHQSRSPAETPQVNTSARQRRKSLRRRNRHPVAIAVVVIGIVLVVGLYEVAAPSTERFPFPCLSTEGEVIHVHPYLRLTIGGQDVTIPTNVGFTTLSGNSCLQPMHTHDASGIIHIESPTMANYTLGDFFTIWKDSYGHVTFGGAARPIVFNSTDILGFKADATHRVVLLVDGKVSNAYGSLQLDRLDYCSSATTLPPCSPTAVGNPIWNGGNNYPYGTGHTIVIEYVSSS